uniref:Macaca fascicularis brain cDNA clone: QflA-16656, similar to human monooxygenase, DBH-like 1 (MOXD1), mRNA, RefSeq: NM_015529.1 n=1 Tax=Macaca fascicularis TaxID=9541 RepID=I7GMD1_MACFA|nr:unnamed protein product [Macaca fascicularis]
MSAAKSNRACFVFFSKGMPGPLFRCLLNPRFLTPPVCDSFGNHSCLLYPLQKCGQLSVLGHCPALNQMFICILCASVFRFKE